MQTTVQLPPIVPLSGFHGAGAAAVSLSGGLAVNQDSAALRALLGLNFLANLLIKFGFRSESPWSGQT